MRILTITLCALIVFCTLAMSDPPKVSSSNKVLEIDQTTFIDANRILMFVTNYGSLGRDLSSYFGYIYGTFYPYAGNPDLIANGTDTTSPLYAAGLQLGGIKASTGDTLIAVSEYNSEFVPGPMIGGFHQTDRPAFRVYKLYGDSLQDNPNTDYTEYLQTARLQGAPITLNGADTVPEMYGDQFCWSVYNDADASQHNNRGGRTEPLFVEVRQSVFAFEEPALSDIVFIRYRLYNKGSWTLNNFHITQWVDPVLGFCHDDYYGIDTVLGIGYCYNKNDSDSVYGLTPPCIGYGLLQGPVSHTGDMNDTARSFNQTIPGYKNLPLKASIKLQTGTDPDNYRETFLYMNGLTRIATEYMYNGFPTKFVHGGDPVTGTGDLDIASGDRRMLLTINPITFAPGDSTEVIFAMVIGHAGDRLASITDMRNKFVVAQQAYRELSPTPLNVDDYPAPIPSAFELSQNFPNPFNPETAIKFTLNQTGFTELNVFNILGELVASPVNEQLSAGPHQVTWDGKDMNGKQLASGIYFYRLKSNDISETKKMVLVK